MCCACSCEMTRYSEGVGKMGSDVKQFASFSFCVWPLLALSSELVTAFTFLFQSLSFLCDTSEFVFILLHHFSYLSCTNSLHFLLLVLLHLCISFSISYEPTFTLLQRKSLIRSQFVLLAMCKSMFES